MTKQELLKIVNDFPDDADIELGEYEFEVTLPPVHTCITLQEYYFREEITRRIGNHSMSEQLWRGFTELGERLTRS